MKPIAIFRHLAYEGPGYFATFLERRSIPWQLVKIDENETLPADPGAYSGLVFMGGPMSVNDDLPWIPRSLALIRQAVEQDIPLLGHCLGGQLIAKALGAAVERNPVKEIGWGQVAVADTPTARSWFGGIREFESFHWHGETFSLPPQAELILSNPYCAHQAYALGKHLGMQCHVEMTVAMVREWTEKGRDEISAARASPAVQSAAQIEQNLAQRVATLNAVADTLYTRWIAGLA
ncbi:MAG: type 1 glutamine amidotransferase [Sulfuricellaceae bacterium]|nr:type 1 glutamine amidotransferase [Sulfuricellaceae bacterium]